jgi:hypothetical protein
MGNPSVPPMGAPEINANVAVLSGWASRNALKTASVDRALIKACPDVNVLGSAASPNNPGSSPSNGGSTGGAIHAKTRTKGTMATVSNDALRTTYIHNGDFPSLELMPKLKLDPPSGRLIPAVSAATTSASEAPAMARLAVDMHSDGP